MEDSCAVYRDPDLGKLLLSFLLETGCRKSEVNRIKVSQVNYDYGIVTFDTKGGNRRRAAIGLDLRESLAVLSANRSERSQTAPLLFARSDGGPVTAKVVDGLFKHFRKTVDPSLPGTEQLTPHITRHTTMRQMRTVTNNGFAETWAAGHSHRGGASPYLKHPTTPELIAAHDLLFPDHSVAQDKYLPHEIPSREGLIHAYPDRPKELPKQ